MPITATELDEWARAYIEAQLLPEGVLSHEHCLWWSVERFMRLPDKESAEDAWKAILEILARTRESEVLEILAAGPLEDLICEWGRLVIDRIEGEANRNPDFRALLAGVWERGDPSVCARVAQAKQQSGA
jgi:hypothetical protein